MNKYCHYYQTLCKPIKSFKFKRICNLISACLSNIICVDALTLLYYFDRTTPPLLFTYLSSYYYHILCTLHIINGFIRIFFCLFSHQYPAINAVLSILYHKHVLLLKLPFLLFSTLKISTDVPVNTTHL